MASARAYFSTDCADGMDKAEIAGGGGDVHMPEAAGAAGGSSAGAGNQAGGAGSAASGDSGSRRNGSSTDNGRDMRGGVIHSGYPEEAEDQAADLLLFQEARPSLFRGMYFSLPPLGARDAVPIMTDDALMDAATNNRLVAFDRIERDHWGTPQGFINILNDMPDDRVDAVVAEVHGNANFRSRGEARQA